MKTTMIALMLFLSTLLMAQDYGPYPGYTGVVILKSAKWPCETSGKTVIEVSWENPSPENRQARQWVREAVEATWEQAANIDFVGWGAATSSSRGIRIVIDNYGHPHCKGLGTNIDGMQNGMLLNFEFSGTFKCNKYKKEDCIKFIAAHEFGHALGLAHEHNRKDCLCDEDPQGTDGNVYVTPCDPYSIMNYCNPNWCNNGTLSDYDKAGIAKVYGKPGTTTSTIQLAEIRLIPCASGNIGVLRKIKSEINGKPEFSVKSYTEEDKPVPDKAVKNLPGPSLTIRYFHPDDESKAEKLKVLLAANGFSSVAVQNMLPKMTRSYPNYLEIWYKGVN